MPQLAWGVGLLPAPPGHPALRFHPLPPAPFALAHPAVWPGPLPQQSRAAHRARQHPSHRERACGVPATCAAAARGRTAQDVCHSCKRAACLDALWPPGAQGWTGLPYAAAAGNQGAALAGAALLHICGARGEAGLEACSPRCAGHGSLPRPERGAIPARRLQRCSFACGNADPGSDQAPQGRKLRT